MRWLASKLTNRAAAWSVVATVVLVALLSAYQATKLQHEDDLLAFLPEDNPDVELFNNINRQFGTTDLALVGIEVDNPFDPAFLGTLQRVTRDLDDFGQLNNVASLANITDYTLDPVFGGIITAPLVEKLPESKAEEAALRDRVMGRDHLVGNFISADGHAVLIYCYLAYGADPRIVADRIHGIVEGGFPELKKYWGGAPFVSTYIYNATREDLRRLTPWAVLAIIAIMMLVFRDFVGTGVTLISTAIGTVISLGIMATAGVQFNIVLSAMPVVLFAIGSAYGVHILARYYALAKEIDSEAALQRALIETGPVVIAAGLTTAASLLSFVLMDIKPLRTFGLFSAIGIVASLVLAITFVPAVVSLTRLKNSPSSRLMRQPIARLTAFAAHRRVPVGLALAALAIAGGLWVSRVDTSVDYSTFFVDGSPPDQAEQFLSHHFGGSQFIQIHVKGDMNDPHVLREMRRIADRVTLLDDVTSVNHIGAALALSNDAFTGQGRIPDTAEQVGSLYAFLDDPAVGQLVTQDRSQAIIHVRVRVNRAAEVGAVLTQVEAIVDDNPNQSFRVAYVDGTAPASLRDLVAWRVRAITGNHDIDHTALTTALSWTPDRIDPDPVRTDMARFLRSSENAVPLPTDDPELAERLAAALVALGPSGYDEDALIAAIAAELALPVTDLMVEDLLVSVGTPLVDAWAMQRARQRRDHAVPIFGDLEDYGNELTVAMLDLDSPTALVPTDSPSAVTGSMRVTTNGLPVMHRGMSFSVTRNQLISLGSALVLVLLIMCVVFRSVATGLLATVPTLLTLVVIYGGMGVLGVHLDIGTSMLACIVLGAGVDYGVHLVSSWNGATRVEAASRAAENTGPAILVNAVMIAAGFVVLTLGEAKPLQNVGSLTAASMLVAAAATFLAIPVLARRTSYRGLGGNEIAEDEDPELVAEGSDLSNTQSRE